MNPARILLAAAVAATGKAGAAAVIAVLGFMVTSARVVLPVLPQLALAGEAVTVTLLAVLLVRELRKPRWRPATAGRGAA